LYARPFLTRIGTAPPMPWLSFRIWPMIELYELAGEDPEHRFSPYCWRIRLALAHKGLEPVTIPWRLHETRLLPGAPGNATVPVLVDDGVVLGGSTAIAFHLEEAYPNGPSLFGGPGGEAHGRFVLAWADLVLIPSLFPILAPAVFAHLHPADRAYFRASREKRLGMTLEEAARRREGLLVGFRAGLAPLRAAGKSRAMRITRRSAPCNGRDAWIGRTCWHRTIRCGAGGGT
jgi:glutathione S-transferase